VNIVNVWPTFRRIEVIQNCHGMRKLVEYQVCHSVVPVHGSICALPVLLPLWSCCRHPNDVNANRLQQPKIPTNVRKIHLRIQQRSVRRFSQGAHTLVMETSIHHTHKELSLERARTLMFCPKGQRLLSAVRNSCLDFHISCKFNGKVRCLRLCTRFRAFEKV